MLPCAQQWPEKLLPFLTMIWFCDHFKENANFLISLSRGLTGSATISRAGTWGALQDFESTQPTDLLLSQHTITGVPSLSHCAVLVLPAAQMELRGKWSSSSQTSRAEGRQVQLMHYCCSVSIVHLPGSVIVPETLALPLCPQVSPVASAIQMDMAQMPDDSRQESVTV